MRSAASSLAILTLVMLAGCATTGATRDQPTFAMDLSADPDILLVEARAYLIAGHYDDAAARFDKLLSGLDLPPDQRLFISAGLFLARNEQGRLGSERQAATGLLNAWEAVPGAADDPQFAEIERLLQRATLVLQAAEAELDPEFSAGPSNAIVVYGRSDADFFLSRSRCGPDLQGTWEVTKREDVSRYREHFDRVAATCDKGGETRDFWVDTSIWAALVATTSEGAEPPVGFTREEAERFVEFELQTFATSPASGE